MSSTHNSIESVEKVLGEPAFVEFSENTWKIRTNLMLVSVIAIAVVFGDLHIEPDSQVFGLKFRGLSDQILTSSLIAVVTYLSLHFLWASLDALQEWRLRVTGTRVAFVTTARLASELGDYPDDPRQSTLYNWWKDEALRIGNLVGRVTDIEGRLATWEKKLKDKYTEGADAMNIVNATQPIAGLRDDMMKLSREIRTAQGVFLSARIPTSLHRFDRWFGFFLRSQNLRWLLIDFLVPILAGCYALLLLFARS